jgi:hypothetical protein
MEEELACSARNDSRCIVGIEDEVYSKLAHARLLRAGATTTSTDLKIGHYEEGTIYRAPTKKGPPRRRRYEMKPGHIAYKAALGNWRR